MRESCFLFERMTSLRERSLSSSQPRHRGGADRLGKARVLPQKWGGDSSPGTPFPHKSGGGSLLRALVLRESGIGVPEGRSVFRLKWERISKGALFFPAPWGLLAGIASDSAVEWEFCPIERQGRFAAAGCGKRAWWGRIRFLSGEAQMEWGIASTAELGFARQVGKELFLAADSFHVGSARGSGESAGVGLTRPWSGAVSCRSGAGAALERCGFLPEWG